MIHQLRALAVFARTVEHGSFRSAARELGLSPSVVSHHISQLEEQLGVALLYRSTRSLSLTRDGERLIDRLRPWLRRRKEGLLLFSIIHQDCMVKFESLRLLCLLISVLADKISLFLRTHPNVKIRIDYSDERRDVVADGIDVAIRMGWLRDSSLKARKLYEVERVVMASQAFLRGKPIPKSPKDIEQWDWLELGAVPLKPLFRHASCKSITLRPSARLVANSASGLYELAVQGAGVVILPRFLADADVQSGAMEILLPDWNLKSVSVYAVRPQNAPRDGLTAAFVDFIAQ